MRDGAVLVRTAAASTRGEAMTEEELVDAALSTDSRGTLLEL